MAAADTARLIASLELRDKEFLASVKRATGGVTTLERRFDKLSSNVGRGLHNAGQNLEKGIVVGATAAAGALTYAVKAAVDWESAVAGVNKTIEATPAELKEITDGLLAMSSRMPIAATELASIAEAAGAMGITGSKNILAFTDAVAILGTTTNVTTEDAATALGQLQNVIGLTGDEFDNFAASLVDLGNKGASTEAQILEIARRSGGAAKLIGVAKNETLGWASAAANLGLNEELAGTALQNFFIKSQNLISAGGGDLNTFAKISGKTAKAFKKAFAKDAGGALEDFLQGLGKMPKDKRIKAVQDLFGKGSGLTRLILGLSDSVDQNLTPALNTSAEAWEKNTAATEEAQKRFKTTASQLATLKNNVNIAAITIGQELLPVLADLSKEAVTWLQDPKTQQGIKAFAKDLGEGAREAVRWLKSLDWNAIANALKTAGGFAKGIVDAFVHAPPWVQQFLTVGFVANKFTGGAISGAISSIVGDVLSAKFKAAIGIQAGVVNVNGGVVNGGGAGVAGAAKGGIGVVGKFLLVGELVGLVAAVNSVREGIQGKLTGQATALRDQNQVYLASNPTTQELQNSLAAIDSAINDLQADPLAVALVTGPALEELKQLRASTIAALGRIGEATVRDTASSERLEAMFGPKVTEAAKLTVVATERAEALASQKADQIKAQLAAGDTRSEMAAARIAAQVVASKSAISGAVTSAGGIVRGAVNNVASVTRSGTASTTAAIRNKRWQFTVRNTVNTSVSIRDYVVKTAQTNSYGAVAS